MKKYRCPICGKETITQIDRFFSVFTIGRGVTRTAGRACSNCGQRFVPYSPFNWFVSAWVICWMVCAILTMVLKNVPHWSLNFLLLLSFGLPIALFLYLALHALVAPSVPYYKHMHDKKSIYAPNALVKLEEHTQVKKYMVYGLAINQRTLNAKFCENFKDSMVPAMFIQRMDKDKSLWEVFILDRPIVPDELMEEGVTFRMYHSEEHIGAGMFKKNGDNPRTNHSDDQKTRLLQQIFIGK